MPGGRGERGAGVRAGDGPCSAGAPSQKPTSKAGSPKWITSWSSSTSRPWCTRMFFGLIVAVDQGEAAWPGIGNQRVQEGARLPAPRGGVRVVRLQPQRLEEGAVVEHRGELARASGTRWHGWRPAARRTAGRGPGRCARPAACDFQFSCGWGTASMASRCWAGSSKTSSGLAPGQVSRGSQRRPSRLAFDALGAAEPVHRDAQLGQRLLDDPAFARGALHQHRAVGHTAGEDAHAGAFAGPDAAGILQVAGQALRSFRYPGFPGAFFAVRPELPAIQ